MCIITDQEIWTRGKLYVLLMKERLIEYIGLFVTLTFKKCERLYTACLSNVVIPTLLNIIWLNIFKPRQGEKSH